MNALKKIIVNLSLGVAALVFLAGAGELAIRIFNLPWKVAVDELAHFKYDPPLVEMNGKVSSFRPMHFSYAKPKGVYRILALGDSYTWGDKISDYRNTWPEVLEARLRQRNFNKICEVLNLGACGFTTVNEYELLNKKGWEFSPDLIILQFTLNDPLPSSSGFVSAGEDWLNPPVTNILPWAGIHEWLSSHSYLYGFLNDRWQALNRNRLPHKTFFSLYKDDFFGWKDCQQAMAKIEASARARGVEVICMIFPTFMPGKYTLATYPYKSLHDKVAKTAKGDGMYVLDLLDTYISAGKDFRYWHTLRLNVHPNVEAHRLAAGAIEEYIYKNKESFKLD
jgi:lysophospholipase L1-like esterase